MSAPTTIDELVRAGVAPELIGAAYVHPRHLTYAWRTTPRGARCAIHVWGEYDVIRRIGVDAPNVVTLWRRLMAIGLLPADTSYAAFYRGPRTGSRALDTGAAYPSLMAAHGMAPDVKSTLWARVTRKDAAMVTSETAA